MNIKVATPEVKRFVNEACNNLSQREAMALRQTFRIIVDDGELWVLDYDFRYDLYSTRFVDAILFCREHHPYELATVLEFIQEYLNDAIYWHLIINEAADRLKMEEKAK